jgi:twitching motility protein PilT
MVLVTGPTGSGKTTTLAAMIDHINQTRSGNIITIEDPIEILHPDKRSVVCQREIGTDTKNYEQAMRRVLRQDPDVILIGEMRDVETVSAAMMAAETGHLVLSTLHTSNATETINRIVDFFPPFQQQQVRLTLAGVLKGVISQRLVPHSSGDGRVPAIEVMVVTGRIADRITDPSSNGKETLEELIADGEYHGMQTFDQSLFSLFKSGEITLRSALAAATNPHDFRVALQSAGLVTGP